MTPTFWPVVLGLLALLVLISARGVPFVIAIKVRRTRPLAASCVVLDPNCCR
ncbi:hypothetical protein [Nocardia sp. NPDC004260]